MRRRRLVVAALGLAIVGCAAQAACRKPEGAKMETVVEEYPPAKGADALFASPNGNFLAAQYNFGGSDRVRPLIKILERAKGTVVATARGQLACAVGDDGEAFYV